MSGKASIPAPPRKAPTPPPAPAPTTTRPITPNAIPEAAHTIAPSRSAAPMEDAVRSRAYSLWEEAGCPECDGVEFWLRAERELASH